MTKDITKFYKEYIKIIDENITEYKDDEGNYFEDDWFLTNILHDEIEIVENTSKEDKKIKKLNEYIFVDGHSMVLKINEIIDKINGE